MAAKKTKRRSDHELLQLAREVELRDEAGADDGDERGEEEDADHLFLPHLAHDQQAADHHRREHAPVPTHQLAGSPSANAVMTTAIAAGLKMCLP